MYEMPVRISTKGDEHWQRWVERGEARDRVRQQRLGRVALSVVSTILLWFAVTWTLR
jgi:membrane protein required for beta-lactamase induction